MPGPRYSVAMSLNDPERFDHLLEEILTEIERNPGGVSEFDLIRALAARGRALLQ